MKTYSQDPYWMTARFDSTSADGQPIRKGDRIFYFPRTRSAFVGAKAEQEAASFAAAAQDEAFMSGEAC